MLNINKKENSNYFFATSYLLRKQALLLQKAQRNRKAAKNMSKALKEDDFNNFSDNSPGKSNNLILRNEKAPSLSISEIKKKSENVNRNNLIPKSKDFIELKSSKKNQNSNSNSLSRKANNTGDKREILPVRFTSEYLELENKFNEISKQNELLKNELKHIKQEKFEMESFIQEITELQTKLLEENNAFREILSKNHVEQEVEDTPKFNSELPSEKRYSQHHFNSMKEKDDIIRSCMDEKKLILDKYNELKEDCQSMKNNVRAILTIMEDINRDEGMSNDITTRLKIENRLKLVLGMDSDSEKRGSKSFIKSKSNSLGGSQKGGLTPKIKELRMSTKNIRFIKPQNKQEGQRI